MFAIYGKEYYPAIVLKRMDINLYEVIYVQDRVVKRCPRGSIIPLTELKEGNMVCCLFAILQIHIFF